MNLLNAYQEKRRLAEEAVRLVGNGETIVVPTGVGEPPTLLAALAALRREFVGVTVAQLLPLRKFDYFDPGTVEHVRHLSYFFSAATRSGGQEGWIDYVPAYFSELPMLLDRRLLAADVVFTMASPMDHHGYFALSLAADYTMAAVRRAKTVVLEVNPNVPFAHGNCHVHISQVSAVVENDDPVLEVGLPPVGPVQQSIGKFVADLIPDGATLQIGYGSIPDAVVMQLTDKHDLGIHTEMIGSGIMTLVENGVVTNRRKNYHRGKMLASFALGDRKLYRFMHRNPALEMHPVDFTNDPYLAVRTTTLSPSTEPCRWIWSVSAVPRPTASCPIRAPAGRLISSAPPIAPKAARPSSSSLPPPRMIVFRALFPPCPTAPTSPPARTT